MKAEKPDLSLVRQKFDEALINTIWSETGAPSYIIKEGLDPEEYSIMAKQLLEAEQIIAHDFTSEVRNESGSKSAKFDYKSGWFLEGLGEGEVE